MPRAQTWGKRVRERTRSPLYTAGTMASLAKHAEPEPDPLDFTLTGSPLFIIGMLVERINELAGGSDNLKLQVSATIHVLPEEKP